MITAFFWDGLAAASILIGYALARRGLSNRSIGMVMGIGAGALISVIAYELVPETVFGSSGWTVAFGWAPLLSSPAVGSSTTAAEPTERTSAADRQMVQEQQYSSARLRFSPGSHVIRCPVILWV